MKPGKHTCRVWSGKALNAKLSLQPRSREEPLKNLNSGPRNSYFHDSTVFVEEVYTMIWNGDRWALSEPSLSVFADFSAAYAFRVALMQEPVLGPFFLLSTLPCSNLSSPMTHKWLQASWVPLMRKSPSLPTNSCLELRNLKLRASKCDS